MRVLAWILASAGLALLACAPISAATSPAAGATRATAATTAATTATSANPATAPGSTWSTEARGGTLTVRFLDVGQGDSALITTDDRHALLIDAGPPEGAARVARALDALGGAVLDAVILTHAHADHVGDMGNLTARLSLGTWIDAGFAQHPVHAYTRALATLEARHIPVHAARQGDHFALGAHADVHVLLPREPLFHGTRSDPNSNSVVVRVDHHGRGPNGDARDAHDARFLFVGDAEQPTEQRLLEDPPSLRADVLKVAHHGSAHSSTEPMIAAVAPRLAVISCGTGNDFGHPAAATLARLEAHHVTIARTDLQGDVTVTSDDRGVTWVTARPGDPSAMLRPGVQKNSAEMR